MPPIDLTGPIVEPPKNYLDKFDPNNMPQPFATYTYGRNPHFKLHNRRADATSAMTNNRRSGVVLFEHTDGRWKEIARFQPREFVPTTCDMCRQTTMKDEERYDSQQHAYVPTGRKVNGAKQVLERKGGGRGKLVYPLNVLTLCTGCQDGLGY